MTQPRPRLSLLLLLAVIVCARALPAQAADLPVDKVFAAVPFDRWVKEGPAVAIPWKVRVQSYGLSLHQRLLAETAIELAGRELIKRRQSDRMAVLVQLTDAAGKQFRNYSLFRMKELPDKAKKIQVEIYWYMFVLPGDYTVTMVLLDGTTGEHNLMQGPLHIEPPKNDPLPESWAGLPAVEFLEPKMEGPDRLFRPDIKTRLHLPLATRREVKMEVLADVTASDLFHGSTMFYNRYLSVAVPLLKALSQISLERGSLDVAMLDLRKRTVTFEQNDVKELDWPRARSVLAPENGPATIDIKALEQKRESPAFLQDELLRRLNTGPAAEHGEGPLYVFVIIGSPMDFYSFRDLPHLPPGSQEKCVVYYLQFELLNPQYADGAIGNVRKMLKPLPVHVFKVRSAESLRHALAKILAEVSNL